METNNKCMNCCIFVGEIVYGDASFKRVGFLYTDYLCKLQYGNW